MTLADRLAAGAVLHLVAKVTHGRKGAVRHRLAHAVDHVLLCPEVARSRGLFSRNRFNLWSLHDP